jgi:hypothetical protein
MEIRHLIVSSFHSRLVSAAMFDTATLRYGVPFAIGPAAVYARWRISRIPPAAYLTAAMFAMSITTLSSGWIAPILIRHHMTRQHDRFARWAAHAPSSSTQGWYVPPVDFSAFQPAKPWPELIVSAAEPPRHAFAMTPRYVAPGEKERPAADRREIIERLSLVVIAVASAVVGTIIGGLGHARASVNATEATSDAQ